MTDTTNPAEHPAEEERIEAAETAEQATSVADGDTLQAEVEQWRAQYQRAVADYQNLERRSREERAEVTRFVVADAIRTFLPVLDDLDRALDAAATETDEPAWVEGVRLVVQKFRGVLQQHGVEELPALGEPFDPNCHEAVGAADGPEGRVVHLLQRGYTMKDRVIRPAMVMVGNGNSGPSDGGPPTE